MSNFPSLELLALRVVRRHRLTRALPEMLIGWMNNRYLVDESLLKQSIKEFLNSLDSSNINWFKNMLTSKQKSLVGETLQMSKDEMIGAIQKRYNKEAGLTKIEWYKPS